MNTELTKDYLYHIAFQKKKVVSVMIELLTKCNLQCSHCYLPEHRNPGLSKERIIELLYEMRNMNVLNVTFTGGEIFLHPNIMDFIKLARDLHMRVFLLSNGTILNEETVRQLSELNITEFSTTMFSLNPNIHDQITQTKGSLQTLLKNLELLKKYNINIKVKTPIMDLNAFDFREIKRYCDRQGFSYLCSPTIFSKNDGDESPKELRATLQNTALILKEVDMLYRNGRKKLTTYDVPCSALFYNLAIDARGNVHPCNSFLYKLGNVLESSLNDIAHNSTELQLIQQITNSDLHVCSNCKYKEYCDRCPGMAYMDGDILGCDKYAKTLAEIRAANYIV